MQSIVVVDHGSRAAKANAETERLRDLIRSLRPDAFVALAHLELLGPTLGEAVEECVRRGATEVAVLPYFLGSGRHVSEDVPRIVAAASERFPSLKITLGRAIGPSQAVAEILLRNAGL